MSETERLIQALEAWAPMVASGYEVPAAGQVMMDAARLLREFRSDQDEERLKDAWLDFEWKNELERDGHLHPSWRKAHDAFIEGWKTGGSLQAHDEAIKVLRRNEDF